MDKENRTERDDLIIGRNAVAEALKSGRAIDTLLVSKGDRAGSIGQILAKCRSLGIVIKEVDRKKLDMLCNSSSHQGVAAYAASHEYASMDDIFALAEERGEKPFIVICDELEDPHNLGAVLRTAEATGVHGVIIPKRRNASLSYVVGKASAGAVEYVPVVRVANIAQTMEELKEKGIWFYGADMDGENWCSVDYDGGVGLVIGSEGRGISRLVKEKCDFVVSMPMKGRINSLNASVAAAVLMFEKRRQDRALSAK